MSTLTSPCLAWLNVNTTQAKRALNYSVTGELVVPGQRLGEFSKVNWGDKIEFREGRPITVNTTSSLVTVVRKLENKPVLWRKIIRAAIEASLPKKRRGGDIEAINVEAVPAADFDLVDNDSEWYGPFNFDSYSLY